MSFLGYSLWPPEGSVLTVLACIASAFGGYMLRLGQEDRRNKEFTEQVLRDIQDRKLRAFHEKAKK